MATNKPDPKAVEAELLCGNASDNIYLTFKGGCRETVQLMDCYRCTGCGGRFHKDCILKHFQLEKEHDWGRQEERQQLDALIKSSNQALLGRVRDKGPKDPHFHFSPNEYKLGQLDTNAQWHQAIDEVQKELS